MSAAKEKSLPKSERMTPAEILEKAKREARPTSPPAERRRLELEGQTNIASQLNWPKQCGARR